MKKLFLVGMVLLFALVGCSDADNVKESMSEKDMMKDKKMEETKKEEKKSDATSSSVVLEDMEGKEYKLGGNSKKTYVKFWASWCPICLSGLDELNKLSMEDKDFEVISVVSPNNLGEKNKEEFKKWFSGLEYKNIKVLFDNTGDFINKYGIRSVPTSVVIDSKGETVKSIPGHVQKDLVESIMKEVN